MALAAVGSNLITFVFGELHFPLSQAANVVTNFVGTVFILSPLGGFLSDSYAGCFWTLLAFAAVELAVRATVRSTTTYILLTLTGPSFLLVVPLLPSLLFFIEH
jgi:nitrate/nitrite transporter NarK